MYARTHVHTEKHLFHVFLLELSGFALYTLSPASLFSHERDKNEMILLLASE
jgi:hypothetical protein